MKILLDTGTADPDDVLTIAYLVDKGLSAVTLWPGSDAQVGLVKTILNEMGRSDIPVGGNGYRKDCVSGFYSKVFDYKPMSPDGLCKDIAKDFINETILTCEAPFNLDGLDLNEWYAQGGYAPPSLMHPSQVLTKFKDVETIQSFNFGSPSLIDRLIGRSKKRTFVSKNVCHGVICDRTILPRIKNPMIKKIMDVYLSEHSGKAFHDLLAASIIFDRDICEFKEVEMYHDKNKWGCYAKENTNTFISVGVDKERFWNTF